MPSILDTLIENREMIQPNHATTLGTCHGGNVLKWMDEVGAMAAMRFAGEPCVTAHINQVSFERPIEVGDTAFIRAYVYDAGKTSVRVRIEVFRENPLSGERQQTTQSNFVYVAIDEERTPTAVPELALDGERERDLQASARSGENPQRE